MLDHGVAAEGEDAFVTVIPLHAVMLVLGRAQDLEDLSGSGGLTKPMPVDDDEIAHVCARRPGHRDLLSSGVPNRIATSWGRSIGADTDYTSALSPKIRPFVKRPRLARPARRQRPDIGGTHWALIGILMLVGIVLGIPLGIAFA